MFVDKIICSEQKTKQMKLIRFQYFMICKFSTKSVHEIPLLYLVALARTLDADLPLEVENVTEEFYMYVTLKNSNVSFHSKTIMGNNIDV